MRANAIRVICTRVTVLPCEFGYLSVHRFSYRSPEIKSNRVKHKLPPKLDGETDGIYWCKMIATILSSYIWCALWAVQLGFFASHLWQTITNISIHKYLTNIVFYKITDANLAGNWHSPFIYIRTVFHDLSLIMITCIFVYCELIFHIFISINAVCS